MSQYDDDTDTGDTDDDDTDDDDVEKLRGNMFPVAIVAHWSPTADTAATHS